MTSAASNPNQANQPTQIQLNNATSPPSKRDLKSWWKGFKLPSKHQDTQETRAQGIFGVPLRQSITYANVAISLIDEKGQSYIYGYVPIVVAKCGVFLKEKATGVEGIFRLSGSEKRIKELKTIFDSPDRYGKGLVWDGYTVHDAANVLRRYLNDLPEPVVPLDLYEKFRDPLRGATKQAVGDAEGPQFVENFNEKAAIEQYQRLITELPPLNRQLLLYILDLLAVFAAKADENRMNSQNLAAIFQPGMLSHPAHAMAPEEYRLNQCVIIFLIENQDHFLIGMQGTAADEKTKKEVESGTPSAPLTPNPNRRSSLGRSASNASAGANSVRRDGKVRRNRSVSSRNSRNEGSSTPNSPALTATPTTGGLARSNTLPSKRSPALTGGRFQRQHDGSSPRSPAHLEPLTQMNAAEGIDQSPQSTRSSDLAASGHLTPTKAPATGRSQERLLEVPQESPTPSKERNLPSLFQRAPAENNDRRQPNKLKKKRIPGSLNPSAQSSNASLQYGQQNAASPGYELPNPLDHPHQDPDPQALQPQPQPPPPIQEERHREHQEQQHDQLHRQHLHDTQLTPPASLVPQKSEVSSEHTPRASQASSNQNLHPDNTLKSKKSPPTSLHSSFNEGSDLDQVLDEQSINTIDQAEKEKKRRWRLSRSKNPDNGASTPSGVTSPRMVLGSNDNADVSNLSISSSSHRPRKSESSDRPMVLGGDAHGSFDSSRDRDESKGPIGWIRNKYREAKESAEQLRNKSPPADRSSLSATSFLPRGKSLDMKRDAPKDAERQAANPPVPQGSISTPAAAPAIASTVAAPLGPTFAPAPSTVPAPQPATVAIVNQPPPHHQEPPPPQPLQTEQQQHPTPVSASTSSAGPLSPPAPVLPPVVAPQLAQQQEQEQLQPEQKQAQTQEAKPEQKPVQQPEQSPVSPPVQSEQPLQAQPSEVPHQQPQPEPSKHEQ